MSWPMLLPTGPQQRVLLVRLDDTSQQIYRVRKCIWNNANEEIRSTTTLKSNSTTTTRNTTNIIVCRQRKGVDDSIRLHYHECIVRVFAWVCVFTRAPGVNNLRHITHFQDSVCPSKKLSFIIKQLAAHWSPASCNCSCYYCCWYHCVVIIAVVCALLELIINVYFVLLRCRSCRCYTSSLVAPTTSISVRTYKQTYSTYGCTTLSICVNASLSWFEQSVWFEKKYGCSTSVSV